MWVGPSKDGKTKHILTYLKILNCLRLFWWNWSPKLWDELIFQLISVICEPRQQSLRALYSWSRLWKSDFFPNGLQVFWPYVCLRRVTNVSGCTQLSDTSQLTLPPTWHPGLKEATASARGKPHKSRGPTTSSVMLPPGWDIPRTMGKRMAQKIRPWDPPSPRQGVAKAQLAASRVELRQVAVSRIPAEMTGKVWYCKNWLF